MDIFLLQKSLNPNLPENLAISFYIQSYKLVLAIYQLENAHGNVKYETQQAECSVPWLNDALVLLTIALQLCQRLKDKVSLNKIILNFFTLFEIFFRSVFFLNTKILQLVLTFLQQWLGNESI